ncbi:MAG: hypothetical protein ACO29O_02365 [Chitinophagaceae bacterium]
MKWMLIVIFTFCNPFIINTFSQDIFSKKNLQFKRSETVSEEKFLSSKVPPQKSFIEKSSYNLSGSVTNPSSLQTIFFSPQKQWGIICRKEWELEKSIGLPVRFRLGNLEYVNHMEGKK